MVWEGWVVWEDFKLMDERLTMNSSMFNFVHHLCLETLLVVTL